MQGYPNDSTAPTLAFTCHGCLVKNLHMTLGLPVVPWQNYKHLQHLFHSHSVSRLVINSPNPLKQPRNNGSEIYITLCCLKIIDYNCVGVTEFLMLELAVKEEYICSSILLFSLHILMPEFWFRKDLKQNWPRNFYSLPISVDPCTMCFQGDSMSSKQLNDCGLEKHKTQIQSQWKKKSATNVNVCEFVQSSQEKPQI